MKKLMHMLIRFWKVFFLTVWEIVKEMRTVRGIIALIFSYIMYHGWAVFFVAFGTIVGNAWMIGIGSAVMLFWLGPGTPVIPLIIVTALFIQRYMLFDKKNMVNIVDKWKELNAKEKTDDQYKDIKDEMSLLNVYDKIIINDSQDKVVQKEELAFSKRKVTFDDFIDTSDFEGERISLQCEKTIPANPSKNYVPAYELHIMRDREIVGHINLRIGHTRALYYGGHIGYSINEAYRGHGYTVEACKLVSKIAKKHQMKTLFISNAYTNKASIRVCQKLGAKYVRTVLLPEDHEMKKEGLTYINIWRWDIRK